VHPAFRGPPKSIIEMEGVRTTGAPRAVEWASACLPPSVSLLFSSLSCHVSLAWVRICTAGSNSCSRLVLLLVCVVLLVATAAAAAVPRLCPRFKAVTFPLSLSLSLLLSPHQLRRLNPKP
jgi:hypothetical protein